LRPKDTCQVVEPSRHIPVVRAERCLSNPHCSLVQSPRSNQITLTQQDYPQVVETACDL
jgi:hypothetical protein